MSAKLHHTSIPIAAITATSSAAGYAAANMRIPGVGHHWRSTSTGVQEIDIDLGAVYTAPVLCLQGVSEMGTIGVDWGEAGLTVSVELGASKDRHGRCKASQATSGNVRYLRITLATSILDGKAYYELGAVHVFDATLTLPQNPLLGSEANPILPQTLIQLPNGFEAVIERGPARQRLGLRFRGARTDDLDELARRARAGTCWLDLDVAANRELQWPVRHTADSLQRSFSGASQDEATIPLLEVA